MPISTTDFKDKIWKYYEENKRDLPWRRTKDPYRILVSETMLQQTQVSRVIPKYESFLKTFPTLEALAKADQRTLLVQWQGLGYNRRALNLRKAAQAVMEQHDGKIPKNKETLMSLPGIGQSTAGAVLNFAYNIPAAFIETNIRAVFLHFFFDEASSVSDKTVYELVDLTLDTEKPREWFYALYDYGTMLKATLGKRKTELHQKSKHYSRQSEFKGSNRQLRAAIVRLLVSVNEKSTGDILGQMRQELGIGIQAKDVERNLKDLESEGFIQKINRTEAKATKKAARKADSKSSKEVDSKVTDLWKVAESGQ